VPDDWKWLPVRRRVVESSQDGTLLRVLGAELETSEFKLAKEKLFQMSRVFMDAIDPIFIRDLEGTVIDMNRSAEETYGWRRNELIGKSIMTIIPSHLRAQAEDYHMRCKRGETTKNVEFTHLTKSGATIPVLVSLSLLTNERGEAVGIATIIKDLSSVKRTEEMLRAQTEALARSNKDLEEFAYLAAHDLREPLIGIAAYIKILQRLHTDSLGAQAHQFISLILETITRMDCLIQSLLSYSRLGSDVGNLEPTDCNAALSEALSNLKAAIEASGATVTTESLPVVMANQRLLIQVFQNLISNSIKFAGDAPPEIHVGASLEGSEWRFFVKDNGIGVEPPYFDRIFRIFQRIDSSVDRPGAGIGLANCKKIVEHHGGRIWVESKPGKGSTFFVTIPHRIPLDT
jgi:PAS domain S-box-containing protein